PTVLNSSPLVDAPRCRGQDRFGRGGPVATSINGADVQAILTQARQLGRLNKLTPSPEDWRDCWIYFLMVDRFNNPTAAPRGAFDAPFGGFQGGTIEGIRQKLDYLKELGAGAVWFTPALKNCQ